MYNIGLSHKMYTNKVIVVVEATSRKALSNFTKLNDMQKLKDKFKKLNKIRI